MKHRNKMITLMSLSLMIAGCSSDATLVLNEYEDECIDGACDLPVDEPEEPEVPTDPVETPDDPGDDPEEDDPLEPCKDGTDCPDIQVSCDMCVGGDVKCSNGNLVSCEKDEEGCLDWTVKENCASDGKLCNNEMKACVACDEVCVAGAKRCEKDGVSECTPDSNGCAVWNAVQTCSEDEHCENSACVPGCADKCEEGAKRCGEDEVQVCKMSEKGCLNWESGEKCEFAQHCYDDTGEAKCDYACGDQCDPFSIVIMPDTQNYTRTSNGLYSQHTQWVADHQEQYNIKMVIHMGDVTNDNNETEFKRAIAAHDILAKANIPYTIATGNHEYLIRKNSPPGARSKTLFPNFFNDKYIQESFEDTSWFHGFEIPGNMSATFEVGHLKFAVIAMEFAPRKEVLCWAENLIKNEYKDRYIILTTHGYLTRGASSVSKDSKGNPVYKNYVNDTATYYGATGATGEQIFYQLAARFSNVIMVACGHIFAIEHRNRPGYLGNSIHETLVDYQTEMPCRSSSCEADSCASKADAGNGWLRVMTIDPKNTLDKNGKLVKNVKARTYSSISYYNDKKKLFCKSKYSTDLSNVKHTYDTTFDFSKPAVNEYSNNGDFGFLTADINEDLSGNQNAPSISVNRQNADFIAVWQDNAKNEGGKYDIAVRGFCAGGCNQMSQFIVNTNSAGEHRNPDVAQDSDGNFIVVWEDDSDGDGSYDVMMRGFDSKGGERIPQQVVHKVLSGNQLVPAIAMAPNGDFVVAWQDNSQDEKNPQVWMRGFKADGSELFADKNVMDKAEGSRKKPDVAMADNGSFVVTWEDDTDGNGGYQIYARAFDAAGNERFMLKDVNTKGTGQQIDPAIGMDSKGNFYIAYEDNNGGSTFQIKARGFDMDGKQIYADTVIASTSENAVDPTVCVAEDGRAYFAYHAKAKNSGDVLKRVLSRDKKLGDEASISRVTGGAQKAPSAGCSADGRNVYLFVDDAVSKGNTEILGRGYQK